MRILLTYLVLLFVSAIFAESPDIHTKFLTAVKRGNVAEVESLLKQGAFVDSVDADGRPAISLAAESAKKTDCKIVKALIAAAASNAIENKSDRDILSRYIEAAPKCLKNLVDAGYDLNVCVPTYEGSYYFEPVFFGVVSKASSIAEIKPYEGMIDFSKLSNYRNSVVAEILINKTDDRDSVEWLKYVISKGAFIYTFGDNEYSNFTKYIPRNYLCIASDNEDIKMFEYLLFAEPALAKTSCIDYQDDDEKKYSIDAYIRKKQPKYMNEKLKAIKETKEKRDITKSNFDSYRNFFGYKEDGNTEFTPRCD
ncbi:ankyrin repeat domain-containing protein [Leptospira santarosai]|uniref:ankyrin repeat domain-containing protein n=1 Tax=Leptospira santarosai TaxID=28183 RepID=UPI0024AFCDF9|nr:ankyrin repeat domain-containing protein [Leptospira santarosai]MDI7219379.1 ankyrin repeat domain-containing protein [Leptospira santarosai]